MIKYLMIFLIFFLFFACDDSDIIIENVNIIDISNSFVKESMGIRIKGNRITKIYSQDNYKKRKKVIDGSDKFVIPGLWDMHTDFDRSDFLGLYIVNGVLGICLMHGNPPAYKYLREKIQNNEILGPRVVFTSPMMDGNPPMLPGMSYVAKEESDARKMVRNYKKDGADFIKVCSNLSHEFYYAIIEESKKLEIPVVGHIPVGISVFEASVVGQKSFEHLFGIPKAFLFSEERKLYGNNEIMPLYLYRNEDAFNNIKREKRLFVNKFKKNIDEMKMDSLCKLLYMNDTWQCPTLIAQKMGAYLDDEGIEQDPRLRYFKNWINLWKLNRNSVCKRLNEEDWYIEKVYFTLCCYFVNEMHKRKVGFLAGTDSPMDWCLPGFSLHDELELFVKAGFSPSEALKTATVNPAIFNDAIDTLGTVEEGKIADFLILDANPLIDIGNTRKINAVVYNGRLYTREKLDSILQTIEQKVK